MSKISNILLMLEYLKNNRKYSIKELSEKLEVSPRMIRVYKEELEKAGIFIDTIMGPYGGYVLSKNMNFPQISFSREDYLFLKEIEVKESGKEHLKQITDKVKAFINSNEKSNELKDDIKNYFNILSKGIKDHQKVLIKYNSYSVGEEERIIHPFDLFLYNSGWGCAAYCEKRKDLRHFDLNRIISIKLLDETF